MKTNVLSFAIASAKFCILFLFAITAQAADTPGKRALILGDSHLCGPTGKQMFESLQARGYNVHLFCGVSSAANHWTKAMNPGNFKCQKRSGADDKLSYCQAGGAYTSLTEILGNGPFDLAIVGLGTNSLYYKHIDKDYIDLAKKISAQAKVCRWIGPPHLREDQRRGYGAGAIAKLENRLDGFYASMSEINSNCAIIDSRASTAKGLAAGETTDGIHRTNGAGAAWAELVLKEIFP